MKCIRGWMVMVLLLSVATPVWAVFVDRFESVWEEQGRGNDTDIPITTKLEDTGFTDESTGMEFIFVKGGCYQMGSDEGLYLYNEKPVHEVCVDDFYLAKHEVTQGQWEKILGQNPAYFKKKGENYPVEQVSWDDAQNYLRQLNAKSGKEFRLPTEAEWEYAARSGGKLEKYSGSDNVDMVAWYDGNAGTGTHPVGQKQANGLGLYDMSGNVCEWTADWYETLYYLKSPRQNPTGPTSESTTRVVRGGSWYDGPTLVRSSFRGGFRSQIRDKNIGLRLSLSAK